LFFCLINMWNVLFIFNTRSFRHKYIRLLFSRREALLLLLGGLWVEVCSIGRAHSTLSETHGSEAVPMQILWSIVFPIRPSCATYEEARNLRLITRLDLGIFQFDASSRSLVNNLEKPRHQITNSPWRLIACCYSN